MKSRSLRSTTSWSLIVALLTLWLPTAPAHAALVGTDRVTAAAVSVGQEREQVRAFLQRDDVRNLLQQQGVDANVALSRVDAMTDAEVQTVAGHIDQLPAGGTSVIGVLFAVFVILLVTDILGLTKVFPFTRAIR